MNLSQHIDIFQALPVPYKKELLRLFFEVLGDHFTVDGMIRDGNDELTVEQFIIRCCPWRAPVNRAVQDLGRGLHEAARNMRSNNQSPSERRLQTPTQPATP